MSSECVICFRPVRAKRHTFSIQALCCDLCNSWTHRKCCNGDTDFSQPDLVFVCQNCQPDGESTRVSVDSTVGNFNLSLHTTTESTESQNEDDEPRGLFVRVRPGDDSFDITNRSFQEPECYEEDSINDQTLQDDTDMQESFTLTFSIITNGTEKGKEKLVDTHGHTYTKKRTLKNSVDWRCTVRKSNQCCPATVKQKGDMFTPGPQQHNHQVTAGTDVAVRVISEVKARATSDPFQSAASIVETVMKEICQPSLPPGSRPVPKNLVRVANRLREKTRPKHPANLDFVFVHDFVPDDFLKRDIRVNNQRHLILATDRQLSILSKAKTWYIDATFKVVRRPFYQLLSVHAFVRSGADAKQVPLVFAVMSRRRAKDYIAVFRAIIRMLPCTSAVKAAVLDFEYAMWKALRKVLPTIKVRGCAFHWVQAVWRKSQQFGLQVAYTTNDAVHKFIRQLMALPYLPKEHIAPAFNRLYARVPLASRPLLRLMTYIRNNWIDGAQFPVNAWSVFGQATRTNNDVEGWHQRLNRRAKGQGLHLYVMTKLLSDEARFVPMQVQLVSEQKLSRTQRASSRSSQVKVFELWDQYTSDEITPSQLLKSVGLIVAPKC